MISVVIPCYNSSEYISRALDSVLNQTFQDFEVIVVDNGSTDHTLKIVEGYRQKFSNKFMIFNEPRKGAPVARNRGLSEANGEWVQFLDSDDELLPHKLEQQINITKQGKFDLIIGSCLLLSHHGKRTEVNQVGNKDIWEGLILSNLGRTSSNLWRRQALISVNGWDEELTSSQEYNLLFKILKQNEHVGYSSEPLTKIYVREDSVHKSTNKKRIAEVVDNNIRLRLRIKQYLSVHNKLTPVIAQTINIYIHRYLKFHKSIIPDYVENTLKELKLDLPMAYLIKRKFIKAGHKISYIKNRVRGLIG